MDVRLDTRLFYADAIPRNARNLDLESLMLALRTTSFPGFPRQVFLVDACRDWVEHYDFPASPPGDVFPQGRLVTDAAQFRMFAARRGQLAADLGADRGGAFTEALIDELDRQFISTWPPDMDIVGARVFDRLQQGNQTPAIVKLEQWGSTNEPDRLVVDIREGSPATVQVGDLRLLVNALVQCNCIAHPQQRLDVAEVIRKKFESSAPRRMTGHSDRADAVQLIRLCDAEPGGLEALVETVEMFDGDTSQVQHLRRLVGRLPSPS
jgi:hypothetical protein